MTPRDDMAGPSGKYRYYEQDVPASLSRLWAFLLDRGYEVDYFYDAKSFGNELVYFQRPSVPVQVQMVQDRGQWGFVIGSRDDDIWSLREEWLIYFDPSLREPEHLRALVREQYSMDDQASWVIANLGTIEAAVAADPGWVERIRQASEDVANMSREEFWQLHPEMRRPPGWYPEPERSDPLAQRWWDGHQWTERRRQRRQPE